MRYEYPARFEQLNDEIVVSFIDVPEALTAGETYEEAYREATDALGAALAGYALHGDTLPRPSRVRKGMVPVTPPPLIVAKLALRQRMRELDMSNVQLARRLDVTETVVRRLIDPDHESKLSKLTQALAELGQHLVVGVKDNRSVTA